VIARAPRPTFIHTQIFDDIITVRDYSSETTRDLLIYLISQHDGTGTAMYYI